MDNLKYFQEADPKQNIQTQLNQNSQKRIGAYLVGGLCSPCSAGFEVLACCWLFCLSQEEKKLPVDEFKELLKREEYDECQCKLLLIKWFDRMWNLGTGLVKAGEKQ